MPNLNAALAVAQLEQLPSFIENKLELAHQYQAFFKSLSIPFITAIAEAKANHWLNVIVLENRKQRDEFLETTNKNGVMTRPVWELTHRLPMFINCQTDGLSNSIWLADRLVNIPSSVRL